MLQANRATAGRSLPWFSSSAGQVSTTLKRLVRTAVQSSVILYPGLRRLLQESHANFAACCRSLKMTCPDSTLGRLTGAKEVLGPSKPAMEASDAVLCRFFEGSPGVKRSGPCKYRDCRYLPS